MSLVEKPSYVARTLRCHRLHRLDIPRKPRPKPIRATFLLASFLRLSRLSPLLLGALLRGWVVVSRSSQPTAQQSPRPARAPPFCMAGARLYPGNSMHPLHALSLSFCMQRAVDDARARGPWFTWLPRVIVIEDRSTGAWLCMLLSLPQASTDQFWDTFLCRSIPFERASKEIIVMVGRKRMGRPLGEDRWMALTCMGFDRAWMDLVNLLCLLACAGYDRSSRLATSRGSSFSAVSM